MAIASRSEVPCFDRAALDHSIPDRFARQVECHPRRSAVESHGRALDYASLDARANRVARALVGGREPVALLAESGPRLVAGMLGILKAGRAFVPLDPSFPERRSGAILADAGCAAILCDPPQRALAEQLSRRGDRILEIDDDDEDPGDPGLVVSPDADAYLIYTSGSTGRPKGVVQSHRIVLHNILKYTNNLAVHHDDRWSLLFSPCFGEAMNDIFCALLNGGALCFYDLESGGASGLADWLVRDRITVYHSVPTVYRRMLEGPMPTGGFPHLRAVVLGGEPVHREDVERHRKRFGDCLLVNAYGSTETKLIRQYLIDPTTELPDGRVPVGYAVEDTDVVVLDSDGAPLAAGLTGEIAVRSRFLARYRERSGDHRFRELADGRREFRTGDRGRLEPDGRLHHLGRLDEQVKILGQRIELAEVEAACLRLEGVREAAVGIVEGRGPEPILVGWVALREPAAVGEAQLRRALADLLPGAMIPSRFVTLDRLPVTLTGKIDRSALPAPDEPELGSAAAPTTPTEKLVAQIWESVLDLPAVGVDDDFFALGGDSLAAISVVVGVEQALGRRFAHRVLLEQPTVRELAAALDDQEGQQTWQPVSQRLLALMTSGEKTPFFCVHPNSGSVLGFLDLAREFAGIRPIYAFQAQDLSEDSSHEGIEDLAESYLRELVAVQPHGPYLLGGRCTGSFVAYEMAGRLRSRGERVALLVVIEATSPPVHPARAIERLWSRLSDALRRLAGRARREPERPAAAGRGSGARVKAAFQKMARAHDRYAAQPYGGRIVLVLARDAAQEGASPAVQRWRSHARGGLDWIPVHEGTHRTLLEDPHVADVARRLNALFEETEAI